MASFSRTTVWLFFASALTTLVSAAVTAQAGSGEAPPGADAPERTDYLTFAQGAVPVSVGGAGAKLGADFEAAVRITDGDATAFTIANRASAETDTEFVYHLPAPTTFDRF